MRTNFGLDTLTMSVEQENDIMFESITMPLFEPRLRWL